MRGQPFLYPGAMTPLIRDYLERHGYETMEEGFDTWCLRADADQRLTRAWRRLRPRIPALSVHDEPR